MLCQPLVKSMYEILNASLLNTFTFHVFVYVASGCPLKEFSFILLHLEQSTRVYVHIYDQIQGRI